MVRFAEEPLRNRAPAAVHQPTPPPAVSSAAPVAPTPPRLPITEIARDILRAEAEARRRQQQERSTSTLPPSVMFDNLNDERFTPTTTPPPAELSAYTTNGGLLVYRRVGRDGRIRCMYTRPPNPNNEYDHGAIYLWSLDFDGKHAKRGGC